MRVSYKKMFLTLITIVIMSTIVGTIFLFLSYSISSKNIILNIANSVDLFQNEGTYHIINDILGNVVLDNFTDALMLLKAGFIPTKSKILQDVLLAPSYEISGLDSVSSLISIYGNNISPTTIATYGKYWHGYLTILKPLLCVFSYGQIRCLNLLFQPLFVIVIVVVQKNKNLINLIIPTLFLYFLLMPLSLYKSLQYSTVFYITYIQIFIISLKMKKYNNFYWWYFHFCLFGCITVYYDFLTYPLVSFAIPFLFLINTTKIPNLKQQLYLFAICATAFVFGYSFMWASKWLIASWLTEENIIIDALNHILYRTTAPIETRVNLPLQIVSIIYNLHRGVFQTIILSAMVVFCCFKHLFKQIDFTGIYLLVACLPFCWWLIVANHSVQHCFFTFRILSVSIISIVFIVQDYYKKIYKNL